jgi:hypothetical protein
MVPEEDRQTPPQTLGCLGMPVPAGVPALKLPPVPPGGALGPKTSRGHSVRAVRSRLCMLRHDARAFQEFQEDVAEMKLQVRRERLEGHPDFVTGASQLTNQRIATSR